jgi:nitroreductase
MPDRKVILDAVTLACRAPSLHNSQPWRWKNADGAALHLFADRKVVRPRRQADRDVKGAEADERQKLQAELDQLAEKLSKPEYAEDAGPD